MADRCNKEIHHNERPSKFRAKDYMCLALQGVTNTSRHGPLQQLQRVTEGIIVYAQQDSFKWLTCTRRRLCPCYADPPNKPHVRLIMTPVHAACTEGWLLSRYPPPFYI